MESRLVRVLLWAVVLVFPGLWAFAIFSAIVLPQPETRKEVSGDLPVAAGAVEPSAESAPAAEPEPIGKQEVPAEPEPPAAQEPQVEPAIPPRTVAVPEPVPEREPVAEPEPPAEAVPAPEGVLPTRTYDVSWLPKHTEHANVLFRSLDFVEDSSDFSFGRSEDSVTVSASPKMHAIMKEYLDHLKQALERQAELIRRDRVNDILRSYRVSLEFKEKSLRDAVDVLVRMTREALKGPDEGNTFLLSDPDRANMSGKLSFVTGGPGEYEGEKVSLYVRDMSLHNAWSWLAALSGKKWGLKDDALRFGAETVEGPMLRVYPLHDIMTAPDWVPEKMRYDITPRITIIDALQDNFRTSWYDPNRLEYQGDWFYVVNTRSMHMKVSEMLAEFRRALGRRGGGRLEYGPVLDETTAGPAGWSGPGWKRRLRRTIASQRVNAGSQTVGELMYRLTEAIGMTFIVKKPEADRSIEVPFARRASLVHVMDWMARSAGLAWRVRNEAVCLAGETVDDLTLRLHALDDLGEYVLRDSEQVKKLRVSDPELAAEIGPERVWDGFEPETVLEYARRAVSLPEENSRVGLARGQLMVFHTPEAHARVADLLELMREARELPATAVCTRGISVGPLPGCSSDLGRGPRGVSLKDLETKFVTVDYEDMQLAKAVEDLSDRTGVGFLAALPEGVDPPVTLSVRGTPLRDVLDMIAQVTAVAWRLEQGDILMAPRLPARPVLRIYPIDWFLKADPKHVEGMDIIRGINSIEPDSWRDPHRVECHAGFLFIEHGNDVHEKIMHCIDAFRSEIESKAKNRPSGARSTEDGPARSRRDRSRRRR